MKIPCPNFVPKSGYFYQISVKVCPKQFLFPSFQGNFTILLFCSNFCLFNQEVPVRSPPLSLISGFFTAKKMRNWWNFNGIKENSVPLSGILMC